MAQLKQKSKSPLKSPHSQKNCLNPGIDVFQSLSTIHDGYQKKHSHVNYSENDLGKLSDRNIPGFQAGSLANIDKNLIFENQSFGK